MPGHPDGSGAGRTSSSAPAASTVRKSRAAGLAPYNSAWCSEPGRPQFSQTHSHRIIGSSQVWQIASFKTYTFRRMLDIVTLLGSGSLVNPTFVRVFDCAAPDTL